jgi:GNAT superfamily N-acetyltransferase
MQTGNLSIRPLTDPTQLMALAADATADGHRMVTRLIEEWFTGENRFDKPGERSYIASLDGRICAVCGLNIDPFAGDINIGRVRRLYVSGSVRRRGIGSAIIAQLVGDALGHFRELHLRTYDARAAAFYEAVGFTPVHAMEQCTHRRRLGV